MIKQIIVEVLKALGIIQQPAPAYVKVRDNRMRK